MILVGCLPKGARFSAKRLVMYSMECFQRRYLARSSLSVYPSIRKPDVPKLSLFPLFSHINTHTTNPPFCFFFYFFLFSNSTVFISFLFEIYLLV